jgi:aminoglycoside phosphotransferase (APT) family kinase protein
MNYLGHLSQSDPLFGYLSTEILPQLGIKGTRSDFRVFKIWASNQVYLYEDRFSQARIIAKFFGSISDRSAQAAHGRMEREFNNLNHLRSLGFAGYPHYIARPLGCNGGLNFLLAEEYCYGTPLTDFIMKAIREDGRDNLFQKLTALAYFLATLHNETATGDRVDFSRDCVYFDRVVDQLEKRQHIPRNEAQELCRLKDRWRKKGFMWEDNQVLVHGDVTPPNILFGDDLWVIGIDLERMKLDDRVFDVGRVAAEVKHFFMQYTGNKWLAEPFIGHFLWEYSCRFPNRDAAFASITRRVPFHMGISLLRIARNPWINNGYRRQLIDEAKNTLR